MNDLYDAVFDHTVEEVQVRVFHDGGQEYLDVYMRLKHGHATTYLSRYLLSPGYSAREYNDLLMDAGRTFRKLLSARVVEGIHAHMKKD